MNNTENSSPSKGLRIITNMTFWQSKLWTRHVDSIYDAPYPTSSDQFKSLCWEVWQLFRKRSSYDIVLTMGGRESLTYGLLCSFLGLRSKQILTEVFIDEAQTGFFFWRFKTRLYKRVAKRATGILTNSSSEVDSNAARFRVRQDKIRYVPLHSNIEKPQEAKTDDGYLLAAGRTLRDYETLLQAAAHIDTPVIIIGGQEDLREATLPDHVTILREVNRDTYLDYLKRCTLVVLPLRPTERATGQVVMLEAMGMGKPVVATRSPGTADHIRSDENGILVEAGDATALRKAIERILKDASLYASIAQQALRDIEQYYTFERHAELKLQAIEKLACR